MSDYHIRRSSIDGDSVQLVMHIAVPAETNEASSSTLADAIVADPAVSKVSVIDSELIQAERDALLAGTLIEVVESFTIHNGLSLVAKRDAADAFHTQRTAEIADELRNTYWAWGFNRDVP
jgi:hypothetical protein